MPRFYFHTVNGKAQRDLDGTEFQDFHTAKVEAIRCAGEILKDEAYHIALGEKWHMNVTDETGLLLLRLDFSARASSAIPTSSEATRKSVTSPDLRLVR